LRLFWAWRAGTVSFGASFPFDKYPLPKPAFETKNPFSPPPRGPRNRVAKARNRRVETALRDPISYLLFDLAGRAPPCTFRSHSRAFAPPPMPPNAVHCRIVRFGSKAKIVLIQVGKTKKAELNCSFLHPRRKTARCEMNDRL